eukprot:scaffold44066_cov23-Cyclotella_meneghiniana.AAC.1
MPCCGKVLCHGCGYCLTRNCCPFCNAAEALSDEEFTKRLSERVEKYNDPEAMVLLASYHRFGRNGLQLDQSKAFELFQRASELGCAAAHCHLGFLYRLGNGAEVDKKKAVHHYQIAAIMGNIHARHNLGCSERENGNYHRAMKHFMIAAKCGFQKSLDFVKQGFIYGHVTKEELERTLRGYQAACDETRSEQRDKAAAITNARGYNKHSSFDIFI